MKIWLILCCLAALGGCKTPPSHEVHLKGQLVDMGSQEVSMEYTGVTGDFGSSRNVMLHTDAEGNFDTVLVLNEPAYFNISRNILYLSPGDDLEVYLTPDTRQALFQGRGSQANTFLKDRAYPKGGSYLFSGRNMGPDFVTTRKCVDSLVNSKLQALEVLENVSSDFKENEKRRIWANQINSYLMFPVYSGEMRGSNREETRQKEQEFMNHITPQINRLMQEIAQNRYLDIVDVRDMVIGLLDQEVFFQNIVVTAEMQEIREAMKILSGLDASTEPEVVEKAEKAIATFRNRGIAEELNKKIASVKSLMTGQPAHDIVMKDTAGNEVRLSQFKGRPIFLDCWATWCGPCIQESPAFNTLSEKFKGEDIVFIQLSTDNSRKAWLDFLAQKNHSLPQYNSTDHEGLVVNWQVKFIPRFILIDKDFKIFRAFAPRPSDPAISVCLEELLKD